MDFKRFIRADVRNVKPYRAAEQPEDMSGIIKLNSNENPYPLPESVLQKIAAFSASGHNYYPEDDAISLRKKAADIYGVHPENVIVGNGASDLLSMLYRAMLETGEKVAMPSPGFSLNRKLASLQGGGLLEIDWHQGYNLPVEDLVNSGAKFIIIANPNNPTGTTCSLDDIEEVLTRFDGPVIIDEAYCDFCSENTLPFLEKYPNLIVLRTFSKSYSAAGIRLGFAFGHPDMMAELSKVQNIYSIDFITQKTGIAILENLADFDQVIENLKQQREITSKELQQRGFEIIPSQANFILAKVPQGKSGSYWERSLRQNGIMVRRFDEPALEDHLRIGIGTESQMAAVIKAVDNVLLSITSKPSGQTLKYE